MARNFVRTSNTVGQYISCGNSASLNPANNLSLACWVMVTATNATQLYITRDGSPSLRCYNLLTQRFVSPNGTFYGEVFKNNTTSSTVNGTTVAATNTWYHVCLTYKYFTDGTSELCLYVNGTEEASTTSAVGPLNQQTTATEIGRRTYSTVQLPADARLAECAIYNTTLTAGEVKSLAQGMSPDKVSPQGLVLYAPLVRDLIDMKGNTLTNNGTTVADHPRIYA